MKLTSYLSALALVGGLFTACSQMDTLSPQGDRTNANAKPGTPGGGGGGAISVGETITFSTNPATVNVPVSVSIALTPQPACGVVELEQAVDALGQPTSSALAVNWEKIKSFEATEFANMVYEYTPTTEGVFGFRGHYIPTKGANTCQGVNYTGAPGLAVDLVVGSQVCQGLTLAATLASAIPTGVANEYTFTVKYTLSNCDGTTYTKGKLQGGLTAGVNYLSASPAPSEVRATKQNFIINWQNVSITDGSQDYTVTFTKKLSGTGPYKITGDWSYKAYNANNELVTVGYNNAITFDPNAPVAP